MSKALEDTLALLELKALKDHLANAGLRAIEVLKVLLEKMELFHLMN